MAQQVEINKHIDPRSLDKADQPPELLHDEVLNVKAHLQATGHDNTNRTLAVHQAEAKQEQQEENSMLMKLFVDNGGPEGDYEAVHAALDPARYVVDLDVLKRMAPRDPYMFAVNCSGGMYWDD